MDSKVDDALVVQGGGMRGAYAAGALVGLVRNGAFSFDAVWATSSGAASAAYAVAGQEEGLAIWQDHLHGRRFISVPRFLGGGDLIDLDYLVAGVFAGRVPLDLGALRRAKVPLHVPATDVLDGAAQYFELRRSRHPLQVLRAAMAMPGVVRAPVEIEGRGYVDGGLVDPLPTVAALEAGARRMTVVLTRPLDHAPQPTGRFGRYLVHRDYPGLKRLMEERTGIYRRALALVHRPPRGLKVRVVAPPAGLALERWTTRRGRLLAAIEQGTADATGLLARARPRPGNA